MYTMAPLPITSPNAWGGWYPYDTGRRRGLGDELGTNQIIGAAGASAATIATGVLGSIAASGGTVAGLSAAATSALVPFVGPAIAAATLVAIYLAKGCGDTCIVASNYANEAENALKQNLQAYLSLPTPRPRSAQVLALANFKTVWEALQRACQTPALKEAGQRCVTDRQAGACVWRDAAGQCWNWDSGYRAPIANDPNVVDDSISGSTSSLFSSFGDPNSNALPLLLGAGLILAAVTLL